MGQASDGAGMPTIFREASGRTIEILGNAEFIAPLSAETAWLLKPFIIRRDAHLCDDLIAALKAISGLAATGALSREFTTALANGTAQAQAIQAVFAERKSIVKRRN